MQPVLALTVERRLALLGCSLNSQSGRVIVHKGRLEYAPEILVSIVAILGFGMVGLIFLGLLRR